MIALRLVRRPDGAPPMEEARAIAANGSTIGRAPDCDFVLDDPLRLVSRRHAWIIPHGADEALLRCVSSTSTLQVNGEPLAPGTERAVRDGDRVRIFGFEVLVEVREPRAPPAPPAAPSAVMQVPVRAAAPTPPATPPGPVAPPVPVAPFTPARPPRLDQWFNLDTVADPLGPGSPLPALDGALIATVARPPARNAVLTASTAMLEHTPRAERAHAAPPAPAAVDIDVELHPVDEKDALRRALLRGAGLAPSTPLELSPALMAHLGALLRTMTEGTLDLLRSRAVAKRGMRAEGTRIVARENNLLKFAPDAGEALRLLLNEHSRPGFLDPLDALHDAHDDLQVHQLAMVAGMRAAVLDLISRLGPFTTIDAAQGHAGGLARHFPVLRDAALWRRHRQSHAQLLENLDDAFEAAFSREFLLAYEAQSERRSEAPRS